jgi:hypothetical protein
MKLIETKTLGTAAASIEFTSIPQTFTDLKIVCSLRTTESALIGYAYVAFNGTTTANQSGRTLEGSGSGASSQAVSNLLFPVNGSTSTSNTFTSTDIYVPNYAGSTNKSISTDAVVENNATTASLWLVAGLWSDTAAITSANIVLFSNTFPAGSTVSLYGITKGSDGIVTTS